MPQVGDRFAESGFERAKPKVSEYNKKEEDMEGLVPCLFLNKQMVVLMEEVRGCSAAFGQLISERQNVLDVLMGLFDQRHELNQEVQETERTGFFRV